MKAGCHAGTLDTLHALAPKGCVTCHDGASPAQKDCYTFGGCHEGEVESVSLHPNFASKHDAPTSGCTAPDAETVCHDANVATIHDTVLGNGKVPPSCEACHPGLPGRPNLDPQTLACGTCHSKTPHSHVVDPPAESISINGTPYGPYECSMCHASTGKTTIDLVDVHSASVCEDCHPSPRSTVRPYNHGCVQGGCHVAGTAFEEHKDINDKHNALTPTGCTHNEATCHTGGSDAAAIHNSTTAKCAACHAAGKPALSLNCDNPDCHVGDHSTAHDSRNACHASGHAGRTGPTIPNGACVSCHDTPFRTDLSGWVHNNGCNTAGGCHHADNCSTSACHHNAGSDCWSCHHYELRDCYDCHPWS